MPDDLSVKWITAGIKYNDGPGEIPNPTPRIEVLESSSGVHLNPGDSPYGIPIDGPLAVRMISDFWIKIQAELPGIFQPPGTPPEPPNAQSSWIRQLLDASFAFTVDKNVLLKTLSQSQCEGLRFYLALKTTGEGTPEHKEWLTLVAVGVDIEGKDLHYNWDPAAPPVNYEDVPTISLLSEYGHPPGKLFGLMQGPPDPLDPFVLFKYSQVFSTLGV